jgi:hypothetical protein
VVVRKKRSISVSEDLDLLIEGAARSAGMSYSAWLTNVARREFIIRAGLAGVAEFERENGAFSEDELADARKWVDEAIVRGRRAGNRSRRTA